MFFVLRVDVILFFLVVCCSRNFEKGFGRRVVRIRILGIFSKKVWRCLGFMVNCFFKRDTDEMGVDFFGKGGGDRFFFKGILFVFELWRILSLFF